MYKSGTIHHSHLFYGVVWYLKATCINWIDNNRSLYQLTKTIILPNPAVYGTNLWILPQIYVYFFHTAWLHFLVRYSYWLNSSHWRVRRNEVHSFQLWSMEISTTHLPCLLSSVYENGDNLRMILEASWQRLLHLSRPEFLTDVMEMYHYTNSFICPV